MLLKLNWQKNRIVITLLFPFFLSFHLYSSLSLDFTLHCVNFLAPKVKIFVSSGRFKIFAFPCVIFGSYFADFLEQTFFENYYALPGGKGEVLRRRYVRAAGLRVRAGLSQPCPQAQPRQVERESE